MKLFNTETKKMPARAQIARWIAQGVVLGVVVPGSAFAVAPLDKDGNTVVTATKTNLTSTECYLNDGDGGGAGMIGNALYGDGVWLESKEKNFGIWSCSADQSILSLAKNDASINRTTNFDPNSTYVIYKTVGEAKIGFLKAVTKSSDGDAYELCDSVPNIPVANVCNPTAAASTAADIPVFGPIGLLASLGGLLWFGRRRRKD